MAVVDWLQRDKTFLHKLGGAGSGSWMSFAGLRSFEGLMTSDGIRTSENGIIFESVNMEMTPP